MEDSDPLHCRELAQLCWASDRRTVSGVSEHPCERTTNNVVLNKTLKKKNSSVHTKADAPLLGCASASAASVRSTVNCAAFMAESSEKLCRAFNITVSVKEDISDDAVLKLKNWLKNRNRKYVYAVLEQETSKRHMHMCVFFDTNQNPKNIRDTLWKLIKSYHATSIPRVAVNVQACPGRKWLDEYLQKESSREVVLQQLPSNLDDLEEYFPSEEIQECLQKLKKKEEKAADPFYSYHEVTYKAWLHEHTWVSTIQTAQEYFHWRMFDKKDMRVVIDCRRVFQMAKALHRYSTEDWKLTAEELRKVNNEIGVHDFNAPIRP